MSDTPSNLRYCAHPERCQHDGEPTRDHLIAYVASLDGAYECELKIDMLGIAYLSPVNGPEVDVVDQLPVGRYVVVPLPDTEPEEE